MVSLYHSEQATPCPDLFNLTAYVLNAGDKIPQKTALEIIDTDGSVETWTFQALTQAIRGTATGLLSLGLKPQDRILMRLGNTIDFPITFLAAISVGLIPVPSPAQWTQKEVDHAVSLISPAAILLDHELAGPSQYDGQIIGQATLATLRDMAPGDYDHGDPNRLAYIVFTSGTSGQPRAVMHAHRAIWARRMMMKDWYHLKPSDRLLHAGGLNWTFTLGTGLLDPWSKGATALVLKNPNRIDGLPAILRTRKVTLMAAVPGVYRKVLQFDQNLQLPNLRHCLSAGEKLPPLIAKNWHNATNTFIYEAYGMSECSTFISNAPQLSLKQGALGRPQRGRKLAILPLDGGEDPVAYGAIGIIAVHRADAGLMLGYFGALQATQACFRGDWFLTGDLAIMEKDGAITYRGRADDMMNAGGFRVAPLEVETVMQMYPGVVNIAVTSIEIKPNSFVIAGFYMAEAELDGTALDRFAKHHLAAYKCPKLYIRCNALPMGANGKIQRRTLALNWNNLNG
ncbi:MAG: class I adenylate-forming enzyme family protein [Paracoccaceae bacterium]